IWVPPPPGSMPAPDFVSLCANGLMLESGNNPVAAAIETWRRWQEAACSCDGLSSSTHPVVWPAFGPERRRRRAGRGRGEFHHRNAQSEETELLDRSGVAHRPAGTEDPDNQAARTLSIWCRIEEVKLSGEMFGSPAERNPTTQEKGQRTNSSGIGQRKRMSLQS
ncbi:hypothetical protein T310_8744, partial [Rasamsonia emersonii CBS 393.64]